MRPPQLRHRGLWAAFEPLRETCFCSVFGIDLAEPEGDVQAWVLGDGCI